MINYQYFSASDGTRIAYVVMGKGKPLLYFHGMDSTIESQMPVLGMLQDHFQVIMFDQRSCGMSHFTLDASIPVSARDGYELLRYLHIPKAVFLGYAMGACDIFSYIRQFECERIDKIIFTDISPKLINENGWTHGLFQGWYTREMYEQDLELIRIDYKRFALLLAEGLIFRAKPQDERSFGGKAEEIRKRIWERKPPYPFIAELLIRGLVDIDDAHIIANLGYWKSMAGSDYRDIFEKITVPSLFIAARPGSAYTPETAIWMQQQTKGSQLKWLEDSSHMCVAEKRSQWIKYIKEFGT